MTDAHSLAEKVGDLRDNLDENLDSEVDEAMGDTADQVRQNISENDSVASGRLLQAADDDDAVGGPSTVTARKIAVPWWYHYPEYGTGARGGSTMWPDDKSFPSPSPIADVEAIQQYIDEKGITGRHYDESRRDNGDPSPLAWAIATTIGEIGTEPHPFMRPAWYGSSNGRQHVLDSAKRAINTSLRRF